MQRYIYLDQEDKAKLTKQAFNKQISLSTFVNIITDNYNAITEKDYYLHKGKKITCLKVRKNKSYEQTDTLLTNAVYLYLHGKELENYNKLNLKKLNSKIQSQCDKTIDPNFLKNQLIRANYIKAK